MAVQIPRLKKIQPSSILPKNARIQGSVQDSSSSILNRGNQISSVIGAGADAYRGYEDQKINQSSNEAEQEYVEWKQNSLDTIKKNEGSNPIGSYAQHDSDDDEKFNEILSKHSGSERVKSQIKANLEKVRYSQRRHTINQRNAHIETYRHTSFEASSKLKIENSVLMAGNIKVGRKDSLLDFRVAVNDSRILVANRGLENGTSERLPDGSGVKNDYQYTDAENNILNFKLTPIAKQRMHEDIGKSVKASLDVLITNGKLEEAEMLREEFGSYLNHTQSNAITKKFGVEKVADKAQKKFSGIRGTDEEILTKIRQEKDGEVRDKMEQIHIGRIKRREYLRNNKEKVNGDSMMDRLDELDRSGTPILSEDDLINDKIYKALDLSDSDRLTYRRYARSKGKSSVGKTKPKDLDAVTTMMMREDLHNVPRAKVLAALLTIKESSQRNVYQKSYERAVREAKTEAKGPKVKGTYNSRLNFINRNLKTKLIADGILELKPGRVDTLTDDSNLMWVNIKDESFQYLHDKDSLPSEKESMEHMTPFIIKLKAKGILKKKSTGFFNKLSDFFGDDDKDSLQEFKKTKVLTNEEKRANFNERFNKQTKRDK